MVLPVAQAPGATPPIGSSPVAAPSSNPGSDATAVALVQQAIKILGQAVQKSDPSSDLGQTILTCIQKLAKDAPAGQGAAPGGIENQALRNLQAQAKQQAPLMALNRMAGPPQAAAPTAGE